MSTPIVTLIGHVDVGKTSLLDFLRESKVQKQEVRGITQQIGSTFLNLENLNKFCERDMTSYFNGAIVIDTPGHDCFFQMRQVGTIISDVPVLIIDIQKGLEKQTIECLEFFKSRDIKFIIALNKIDKIYGFKDTTKHNLKKVLEVQDKKFPQLYEDYVNKIIYSLRDHDVTANLYYNSKDQNETKMVPISGKRGYGIPDLFLLISYYMKNFKPKPDCSYSYVLESKKDKNYGDIHYMINVKGEIRVGDKFYSSTSSHIERNNKLLTITGLYLPDNNREMKDGGSSNRFYYY